MWKFTGAYFELSAPQRSDDWFRARDFRCTASKTYVFVTGESKFTTLEKETKLLLGQALPELPNLAMLLGVEGEPIALKKYSEGMGNVVQDVSLCLPVWGNQEVDEKYGCQLQNPLHPNWFIAGSPDGIVLDSKTNEVGNLEIKYPKELYYTLKQHLRNPKVVKRQTTGRGGQRVAEDNFGHIFLSHYMQMQQCMAVTRNKWCDYVVDNPKSNNDENNRTYIERIPFDARFWWKFMYPELVEYVEDVLKPRMSEKDKLLFAKSTKKLINSLNANNE